MKISNFENVDPPKIVKNADLWFSKFDILRKIDFTKTFGKPRFKFTRAL